MLLRIYPFISSIVFFAAALFVALLLLRLIFSYSDPNPFGAVGRFAFKIRKITERFVYPAARLLAQFGVNIKFAPLVTIFLTVVIAYFSLGIIHNTFFIIDGLAAAIAAGNVKALIGFTLYAAISVFILFVFIRFLSSWFVFKRNTFLGFVQRVTDPVLIPLRRLIPPVGMFDISAMILLFLLGFLQSMILRTFVY
ncbi:MAG TPA: YggT family protein [Pyrinomonadaceae bacterium]|nr:YggT family protein [Pyrinomonadaceae bacterium]